jgi:membrane-associated protease RseP (regulator of RpoE activity)
MAGQGVGEDKVEVNLAHVHDVKLGAAVLDNPVFYIIDLGAIASLDGAEADGLVGFEMFRRFRVTVDYAGKVLTLSEPSKFHAPEGAHVVPFELAERIPIVKGTLDGLPVRLSVDTGSRASLSMHSPFVNEHGLVAKYGAASNRITGWGVGGPAFSRPARLGALTLGDVTINDVAGDLFMGNKGAFANPDLSGNLGGGVLRRFTVSFDYDAMRMYLVPNADLAKPDPFDRSGMWLVLDGDALKIVGVAPDGPAAKAGLSANDRIASIDGEVVSKRTLGEWRRRLADLAPGTRVSLSIATGGAGGARKVEVVLADAIPAHASVH